MKTPKTRGKPAPRKAAPRDLYLDLIHRFPLKPLRSMKDLESAVAMMDELFDRKTLAPEEMDYRSVLADLVEAYETETIPPPKYEDDKMFGFLLQIKGVQQAEVAKETGIAVSTISEVLSGKRQLTRSQIGKISRFFQVDPGVFSFDR